MNQNLIIRIVVCVAVVVASVVAFYPLSEKINLGLDLKGGTFLALEVQTEGIPEDKRESEVQKAMEVIRNRVDQFGIASPTVVRQGEDVIIVELPGEKDPERAKNVIGKTARLEFRLVKNEYLNAAVQGNVPEGYEILYEFVRDPVTREVSDRQPWLVEKRTAMTGENLEKAFIQFDPTTGRPIVSFSFNKQGGTDFGLLTGRNIDRNLAIVLDGIIQSAPRIRSAITGGSGIIEGGFSVEEAQDLAVVLNAGALPAEVRIIEERTVGPSLGLDSIHQGITAISIGFVAVLLFMVLRYRASGLVAVLGVLVNIVLILGSMAWMKGTLTLPGLAGILLTIGMSVDANVLIYERVREELKMGRSLRTAFAQGFSRALITIVDANVTTIITAFVLYKFGAGPIRGFAVTLIIGILASMFTALYLCRTVFLVILNRPTVKELSV